MTDLPFDPAAAARVLHLADMWQEEWENYTEPRPAYLKLLIDGHDVADLREVLRQRAYSKDEARLLAEKCAAWRGRFEEQHARADALSDAFARLHARVTAMSDASEDGGLAVLATYGHVLAEQAAQRIIEASGPGEPDLSNEPIGEIDV
jgi:hypothetical protein